MKYLALIAALTLVITTPAVGFAQEQRPLRPDKTVRQGNSSPNTNEGTTTMKPIREKIASKGAQRRAALEQKLARIKDDRKKAVVTRIDEKIGTINAKQTAQMNAALTRLSGILDKIASKGATLQPTASGSSSFNQAVLTAREAIEQAQASVSAQQAKTYVLTITDEASLGQSISQTIQKLTADLHATRQTVLQAKMAVVNAAKELAKLRGTGNTGTEVKEASRGARR